MKWKNNELDWIINYKSLIEKSIIYSTLHSSKWKAFHLEIIDEKLSGCKREEILERENREWYQVRIECWGFKANC